VDEELIRSHPLVQREQAMDANFLRENFDIPPGATGARMVEVVVDRFCQLLA
jgi:hypothetical protein